MQLDDDGNIRQYQFVKTVIRSRVKGVYKEINALLDGTAAPELQEKYAAVSAQLPVMQELYEKRLALRKARGAWTSSPPRPNWSWTRRAAASTSSHRDRGVSECMIEEFMLLANQCAANAAHPQSALCLPHPRGTRCRADGKADDYPQGLRRGRALKGETPTQLELAALLDKTRGEPIQIPVHTGVLRSMQKARYDVEPKGHFGLVLADYAHFTSPIRRYPDLAIHRILTDMLLGEDARQLEGKYHGLCPARQRPVQPQEVEAQRIERDVEDCYKAEYMTAHLGETYTGTVSGVTQRGVFVALDNTVEGFVPSAELCKGETPSSPRGVRVYDPLTGRHWMLGDPMQVQVANANIQLGRIDFSFVP